VDKRAGKILIRTYWSSAGWKPQAEHTTPPDRI
jgi:hypothetical protein